MARSRDLTEPDIIAMVRTAVCKSGLRVTAKDWGISPAYLCHVFHGRAKPGVGILSPLGIEKVVTYRMKEKAS